MYPLGVCVLVVPEQVFTAMKPKAGTSCLYSCNIGYKNLSGLHQMQCVFTDFSLCPTCTDTAAPPTFTDPLVNGTSVTVSWDHTDKGPCFNHLTFSYNITWYPVVGGVPQKREGQSGVTGPGATEYSITNLMSDTSYQAELFGFTPSHSPVFSSVATVGFTTKGVCMHSIEESQVGLSDTQKRLSQYSVIFSLNYCDTR